MRRLLFVPEHPTAVSDTDVYRVFHLSIIVSAMRCLLGYVVLPIITPLLGAATDVGPGLGVPIAIVALVFDVVGIRRFWLAGHRWRWAVTALYLIVMSLVATLLVGDIIRLAP